MGYHAQKLVELAAEFVRQQPRLTAAEVSERLQVHRHTLQRALKASGRNFALMKQALVLERLERDLTGPRAMSLKQVWTELGFASASAFARYVRRATGRSPSKLRAELYLGGAIRHAKGPERALTREKRGE